MRLGVDFRGDGPDRLLAFGKQMGADDAVGGGLTFDPELGYFDYPTLVHLKARVEGFGLRLAAIENVHRNWNDKIKLGLPGRDEQIDNWRKTLRNMGLAGVPVLGYNFMTPSSPTSYSWRTSRAPTARGAADATVFDWDVAKTAPASELGEFDDDRIWAAFEYFIKAVAPVAEEYGVKLALHPDDPPISPLAGIARIFRSHESLQRLCDLAPSDYNGLEFCQGTVAEMPENVIGGIERFVGQGKVHYVHFRNVSGPVPSFSETFIDDGHVDMIEAMQTYHRLGFEGTFIDDHVPGVIGDTDRYIGRAHAMGYIRALIDTVTRGG